MLICVRVSPCLLWDLTYRTLTPDSLGNQIKDQHSTKASESGRGEWEEPTGADTHCMLSPVVDTSQVQSGVPDPKPVTRKSWPICLIVPLTVRNGCSLGVSGLKQQSLVVSTYPSLPCPHALPPHDPRSEEATLPLGLWTAAQSLPGRGGGAPVPTSVPGRLWACRSSASVHGRKTFQLLTQVSPFQSSASPRSQMEEDPSPLFLCPPLTKPSVQYRVLPLLQNKSVWRASVRQGYRRT